MERRILPRRRRHNSRHPAATTACQSLSLLVLWLACGMCQQPSHMSTRQRMAYNDMSLHDEERPAVTPSWASMTRNHPPLPKTKASFPSTRNAEQGQRELINNGRKPNNNMNNMMNVFNMRQQGDQNNNNRWNMMRTPQPPWKGRVNNMNNNNNNNRGGMMYNNNMMYWRMMTTTSTTTKGAVNVPRDAPTSKGKGIQSAVRSAKSKGKAE